MTEKAQSVSVADATITRGGALSEVAKAEGHYVVECRAADGTLKWSDDIHNVVTTEGKNAGLTAMLKASSFSQTSVLGLIESTGYGFSGATGQGARADNVASNLTANATASPPNGWNECLSSVCSSRGSPSFGTASSGSLSLSSSVMFSITGTATIKGCFLMIKSAAGTAPTTTVGSTAGAIYSAGLFSGGDKPVGSGDTLSVSYTASL